MCRISPVWFVGHGFSVEFPSQTAPISLHLRATFTSHCVKDTHLGRRDLNDQWFEAAHCHVTASAGGVGF
jgi:hypothetical protein